ncbi:MAG: phosphotransferase [Planctomycetes bacterium]|nr:phosphotransferase [Planctomycetota bacterium]
MPRRRENLERVVQLVLSDDSAPWVSMLDELDLARPAKSTTLVHRDLYARHMLVDDDGRPCGVIDWGDVHVGDPAIDLSSDQVLNIVYNTLCVGTCLENIRLRQSRRTGNLLHEGPNRRLTGSSKRLGFCETNHIPLRPLRITGTTMGADGPGRPSAGLSIRPKQQ